MDYSHEGRVQVDWGIEPADKTFVMSWTERDGQLLLRQRNAASARP